MYRGVFLTAFLDVRCLPMSPQVDSVLALAPPAQGAWLSSGR